MIRYVIDARLTSDQPIETCILNFGLRVSSKTMLKTVLGSQHWHLKSGVLSGVLEVTWDTQQNEISVVIHDNRRAEWNLTIAEAFAQAIANETHGRIRQN